MAGSLSPSLPWALANPKWAASLNPVLSNPLVDGQLLQNLPVVAGANVINHGLQRRLRGYFVVMNNRAVTFYDSQSTNQMPELNLILNASGPSTVSLFVF